jgi:hypothetical protein
MRKLRLHMDELRVETFVTGEANGVGTVHALTGPIACSGGYTCGGDVPSCPALSCDGCGSDRCGTGDSCWDQSCVDSCAYTCAPCEPTQQEAETCMVATC